MSVENYENMTDDELSDACAVAVGSNWAWPCPYRTGHAEMLLEWFLRKEALEGRIWKCSTETTVNAKERKFTRQVALIRDVASTGIVYVSEHEKSSRALCCAIMAANAPAAPDAAIQPQKDEQG